MKPTDPDKLERQFAGSLIGVNLLKTAKNVSKMNRTGDLGQYQRKRESQD